MKDDFLRYSLKPGTHPLEAVSFLNDRDFSLINEGYAGDEVFIFEMVKDGMTAQVVQDEAVRKSYFIIYQPEEHIAEDLEKISSCTRHPLKINTTEEAIDLASTLQDPTDIYYASISSNSRFQPAILTCYKNALASNNEDVRFFACTSTAFFIGWHEYILPLLRSTAENDNSETIRKIALKSLSIFV